MTGQQLRVVVTYFKAQSGIMVEKLRKTKKISTTTSGTNPAAIYTSHCPLQNAVGA
jgi:hypothetical protein